MMFASSEFVVEVKNTFIEIRESCQQQKRSASCPAQLRVVHAAAVRCRHDDLKLQQKRGMSCFSASSTSTNLSHSRTNSPQSFSASSSEAGDDVAACAQSRWWSGQVWALATDRQGCRELQRALDGTVTDEDAVLLLSELRGRINEASRCPNANYVLQKCISISRPDRLEFVIKEITRKGSRSVVMLARHKYGCRIVQRLLERCSRPQLQTLAGHLLVETEVLATCAHQYGNYSMQHLYEHGATEHRGQLVSVFVRSEMQSANDHQCAVISKMFSIGDRGDKDTLATALVQMPGFIASAPTTKSGQLAVRLARQVYQKC